jgi:hypothetical protein
LGKFIFYFRAEYASPILPLYGSELLVTTTIDAINALEVYVEHVSSEVLFAKKGDGIFHSKAQALAFLATFP